MIGDLVVIRGGGDLGSGVALRLWRAGFAVVILEQEQPVAVRRTVSFCEAIYDGSATVEEAVARRAHSVDEALSITTAGTIAVMVDPVATLVSALIRPNVVIDATMTKRDSGTRRSLAPLTVALGPGLAAPDQVHAVIETNRGPHLGRVLWNGRAAPNTGSPAEVSGKGMERVLRAPESGELVGLRQIGDRVKAGDEVAQVGTSSIKVGFPGVLRGLARTGIRVEASSKIGDVDPRDDVHLCYLVSDKALAVAGGVLEAILLVNKEGRR